MAKKYKMALADALIGLYRWLCRRPLPGATAIGTEDFRSIAIYSTTALGDLMFNTPAIRQLRLRYPQAQLILIVHRKFSSLVRDYADVDKVLSWDGRFLTLFGCTRLLRRFHPDLAVILHSRTPYDVMSAAFSGVRHILRDDPVAPGTVPPLAKWLSGWSMAGFTDHVIMRKLLLLSALGCHEDQVAMHPPCQVNRTRFAQPDQLRIGFQLGASTPERRWPIPSFAQLAESLLMVRPKCQIVLMGVQQEVVLAEQFLALLPKRLHASVSVMAGRTSIREAFDLVGSLDLLVTGDTGPLHIAVALQVPTISLFVTAKPHETGPLQDPALHTVIYKPLPAEASDVLKSEPMGHIRVETVLDACIETVSNPQWASLRD